MTLCLHLVVGLWLTGCVPQSDAEIQLAQIAEDYFNVYAERNDFEKLMGFYAEHAVLEDQDSRAASAFLSGGRRPSGERGVDDPELAVLYEEVQSIEDRIEILKQQKDAMASDLYMKELETLLLELAKKRRALRDLEKKKERTQP